MKQAGFVGTQLTYCEADPVAVDSTYLEKIGCPFISTYASQPDDEFKSGVEKLSANFAKTGQLDELTIWRSVVVSGRKE